MLLEEEVMSLMVSMLLLRGSKPVGVIVGGSEFTGSGDVEVCVRGGTTMPELFPLT